VIPVITITPPRSRRDVLVDVEEGCPGRSDGCFVRGSVVSFLLRVDEPSPARVGTAKKAAIWTLK
jgi:hypothetical protein